MAGMREERRGCEIFSPLAQTRRINGPLSLERAEETAFMSSFHA